MKALQSITCIAFAPFSPEYKNLESLYQNIKWEFALCYLVKSTHGNGSI